jgi:hypothetical protein
MQRSWHAEELTSDRWNKWWKIGNSYRYIWLDFLDNRTKFRPQQFRGIVCSQHRWLDGRYCKQISSELNVLLITLKVTYICGFIFSFAAN